MSFFFSSLRRTGFLFFLMVFFFVLSSLSLDGSEDDRPSIEELSKTKAAQLYFSKDYPEALAEFQKLEKEYPKHSIIQRYIAVLFNAMGRTEEAAAKLREIAAREPEDITARRKLGELYLKQQKIDEAVREFSWVLEKRPGDAMARKKLTRAQELKAHPLKRMPSDEFIQSAPAQDFLKGRYAEALAGFKSLKDKYPDDVLVRRFIALSQLRLKKTEESIQTLKETLQIEPGNKALHYYLGQAYRQQGNELLARQEFRWVIQHDAAVYKRKAAHALFREGPPSKARKNWGFSFLTGYEFDTNATFKSRDRTFSQAGDKNSSRYPLTASGYYQFYRTSKWSFTADSFYSQNLCQDFNRLNTYTTGGGISALYNFRLFDRASYFNLREGISHTFLESKYYTWSDSLSANLIHDLTNSFRISGDYRFALNQFESKGTNPGLTRRDGFDHSTGLAATYYFNSKRTLYFTLGYEYEHDAARGKNFMKHAHEGILELHFPLFVKVSGQVDFRFRDSDYPEYSFTPPPRRDKRSLLEVSISRPIFRNLTLTGKYAYENSLGRNNLYEYNRHILGVLLSWKY